MNADWPREAVGPPIRVGDTYRYLADYPPGCKGGLYTVVRFFQDVPSYQERVLVRCLEGKDAGLFFVVTLWNFATRYERLAPVPSPPAEAPARKEWVADFTSRGRY